MNRSKADLPEMEQGCFIQSLLSPEQMTNAGYELLKRFSFPWPQCEVLYSFLLLTSSLAYKRRLKLYNKFLELRSHLHSSSVCSNNAFKKLALYRRLNGEETECWKSCEDGKYSKTLKEGPQQSRATEQPATILPYMVTYIKLDRT